MLRPWLSKSPVEVLELGMPANLSGLNNIFTTAKGSPEMEGFLV